MCRLATLASMDATSSTCDRFTSCRPAQVVSEVLVWTANLLKVQAESTIGSYVVQEADVCIKGRRM